MSPRTRARSHHLSGARKVWILNGILAAGGTVLYLAVIRHLPPTMSPYRIPWFVLAGMYALAEVFVVHLQFRRNAFSFSLSEIPLVVGLFFMRPSDVVLAQFIGAEARAGRCTWCKVLDEYVGPPKDPMQQCRILRPLDVRNQALLAAIEPDEIAGQASCCLVVAAREVALGALDFDHQCAGVRQTRAAIRRGHRLFEREDREAGQGMRGCHAR